MSTKAPIYLKRNSQKGKQEKLRDILSSDMISSPLGDFRHTIHIGSRGKDDIFGDISFLKGKFHLLPGRQGDSVLGKMSGCARPASLQQQVSPLLKNAISLPVIGGSVPETEAPPKPPRLHLDSKGGDSQAIGPVCNRSQEQEEVTAGRQPAAAIPDGAQPSPGPLHSTLRGVPDSNLLPNAVSLLSLHLDLGPSILDDVLQIMDREQDVQPNLACLDPSPRCRILSLQ
ncbi:cdc42 effector protein 2-like [Chiloscyllium plagiosum]|uniref:cdc42 effector protein 2-like n=1 Tax=Chiloscyllium plagiosum TaxID=36176 RepID=UPI001CB7C088|nr:cdc42 effector protein 2-like [Chiloscyllium plagiosum]